MTGHLIGGILDLWTSATAWACDRRRREETTEEADAPRTLFVSQDLLSWAMRALAVDPDEFRDFDGEWVRGMQRVCMTCPARGRCRRDLATGDFARRYRHYCPNADGLTEMADARRNSRATAGRRA